MDVVSIIAYSIALFVPGAAIYFIRVMDYFDTNKISSILASMAWGVTSFVLAFGLNTATSTTLNLSFETIATRTAPILEELLKAVVLVYFIQRPQFRYFVDGAVYGFAAGIGFAMLENLFYTSNADSAALSLAISRVLSTSLMHAGASSVVGVALGYSRRRPSWQRPRIYLVGLIVAFAVHLVYNNMLYYVQDVSGGGAILLLSGIAVGLSCGIAIAVFINKGLEWEKRRFQEALGLNEGVSSAERTGVQQMGSERIDNILNEVAAMFGSENVERIQRMFIIQANIGILKNNLSSPVSERLQRAWEKEIEVLSAEMNQIRQQLGAYAMTLLRNLLPEDQDKEWTEAFNRHLAEHDPTHVHKFDLFMTASALTNTLSPEQLEQIAAYLQECVFFRQVSIDDLLNLARAVQEKQYSNGQMVFDSGDPGDYMILLNQGYLDVILPQADGSESILRTYGKGEVVGELAMLDGEPRSARVRANGPAHVFILQRHHFNMFVQSRPHVIVAVLKALADRVRYTTDAVVNKQQNLVAPQPGENPISIAPILTDTMRDSNAPLGIFGRLAEQLDNLAPPATAGERD